MKSFTTSNFWEAYATLSPEMKEQAQKAYQCWKKNPSHHPCTLRKWARTSGQFVLREVIER